MKFVSTRTLVVIGILTTLIIAALAVQGATSPPAAKAQAGDSCEALVSQALETARQVCTGLEPGEICYVTGASATAAGDAPVTFATAGDIVTVDAVTSLATAAADLTAGEWGVVSAQLTAGLENGSVTTLLYGDAQIAQAAGEASDRTTLTVWNNGGAPINLRNGAGVGYALVAQLEAGAEAVADGRNEQADWVRIQFDDQIAWVFVPLINWEGDLQTLDVLLPSDVTPVMGASAPFEAITLNTAVSAAPAACSAAPSGMLLQYAGEETAHLMINEVLVEFSDATLLINATANDALDVRVLNGAATVTARGIPETAEAGELATVSLGADSGLTPTTVPSVFGYGFSEVVYTPVDFLPGSLTCVVGVTEDASDVELRVGPGTDRAALARMNASMSYAVTGLTYDPAGNPWWQLDTGEQETYVDQAQVRAFGACDQVAEVEAPPVVLSTGGGASNGDTGAAAGPDLAPTSQSVWQMRPGQDQLSGECSGAPAINFCDHLAAIAPVSGGISWRGMEATPYNLGQVQSNIYAYQGRNALNTGDISISLSFSSADALNMTMILTLDNEPSCQHTYYYTGTRNW